MPLINIGGTNYAVAQESLLPKGAGGIVRSERATNGTDPGRIRTAVWNLSGPVGMSREKQDAPLGVDYVQNLETRFDDLLTSAGKQNTVDLTTNGVAAGNTAFFGGPKFGATNTKFGGQVNGSSTTHVGEQNGYIIALGGRVATQIDLSDWSVVSATVFDATVKGAASWFGKLRVSFGGTKTIQTLTGITSSTMTWSDTQVNSADVLAKALEVGSDRLWLVRASATGTNDNEVRYTLDDFSSISNSFVVGDPKAGATGLGAFGPFMSVGSEKGAFSFTDQGKPVPLSRALAGTRSALNGKQFADPGFGYQYMTSVRGLRALVPGQFDQPIGIGSPLMRGFEGHDGYATAVFPFGDELLVAYQTSGGDTYLYRCVPGRLTQGTGHPDHFPLAYISAQTVDALFGSATPTNPVLGWGEGTNLKYVTQGRSGSDIYDANYRFSTGGGTWYGTTLMRSRHLKKTLRLARFACENMDGDAGDSWQLAVKFDTGAYVNVGAAQTTSGHKVVRPVSGGAPIGSITGYELKPRLTQVAGGASSETSPPQLRGTLEMEYDERPEKVQVLMVPVHLGGNGSDPDTDLASLLNLSGSNTEGPQVIKLPEDRSTARYGMVANVEQVQSVKGDNIRIALVEVHLWDVA